METDVIAPPLGTTVDTVVLKTWYKKEGETVQTGEPLFSVETDKATLDVEAPASGVLRQVSCEPGTEVKTLSRIAVIASPGESLPVQNVQGTLSEAPQAVQAATRTQPAKSKNDHRTFISPRAKQFALEHGIDWRRASGTGPEGAIVLRDVNTLQSQPSPQITPLAERMAESSGLDWTQVAGTGVRGRITRGDIARAIASQPAVENEAADTIPMSGIRELIARRMSQSSAETARVTLATEADATVLMELRSILAVDGLSVSYNDLLIYILARVLREYPHLNASIQGDAIKVWKHVHIGLAVDSDRGLIVPVVRDVDRKGLAEISSETKALTDAVQRGQVLPDDLHGGTFTLTNLGMYGIDSFTPIINLPECAILGVGRISPRPAVENGEVVVRHMVWLSLTFDHRVVDGGPAARFMQRLVQLMARPHLLLS